MRPRVRPGTIRLAAAELSFGSTSSTGKAQADEQPSPSTRLPSSHSSSPAATPLPQPVGLQLLSQPSPPKPLPSSQTSSAVITPLPQPVGLQLTSQPSPFTRLPSSQTSRPAG